MSFLMRDDVIYDEILGIEPATAVSKGDPVQIADIFGFYLKDRERAGQEVVVVYRCRQVLADKVTGTGEDISPGDRVYYIVAQQAVSKTSTGTAGTDYYFCGWCKEGASASASQVLINFDGTRYDEAV